MNSSTEEVYEDIIIFSARILSSTPLPGVGYFCIIKLRRTHRLLPDRNFAFDFMSD